MTPQQEAHVKRINREFGDRMEMKYRAGQAEHGGNLWEKDVEFLLDNAILEAIDQFVYLISLRERLNTIDPRLPFELK